MLLDTSPATPWGYLRAELRRRLDRARSAPELGASAIEWVIITGILVVLAVAVGAAIYTMVTSQAESIIIPDPPGGGGNP